MADQPRLDLRQRTTAARVVAGGLWSALASGLAPFLLLVQSIAAARFLGPTRMGQQSFIAWVELTAALVLSAGTAQTLARYLGATAGASRQAHMRWVLRSIGWSSLALSVLPVVVFAAVVMPHEPAPLRAPWVLAGVGASLLVAQTLPTALLTALQRWRLQATITLVTGALATVGTLVVLAAGGGITGMFAVEVAAFVMSGVWSTRHAVRVVRAELPTSDPAPELRREVIRYAGFATVQSTVAYLVWQRSEFFFLNRYSGPRQIAIYSIAFATVLGLQRLPEGLTQTLIPSLSVLVGADERSRVAVSAARAMRLMWTLAAPLAAGLMAVGPLALRLIYGHDYRGTGVVVVTLVAILPAVLVGRVAASVLHAFGRIRTVLACLTVGIVVDVALCVLLIPDHGAAGAAVANISAQLAATLLEVVAARRVLDHPLWAGWPHLFGATLAAAGCGAAAFAVVESLPSAVGLVVAIVAGSAAYALLFRLLRPVAGIDLAWLYRLGGTRLDGRAGAVLRLLAPAPGVGS